MFLLVKLGLRDSIHTQTELGLRVERQGHTGVTTDLGSAKPFTPITIVSGSSCSYLVVSPSLSTIMCVRMVTWVPSPRALRPLGLV